MGIENETGELFGTLWPSLSDTQFEESIELWNKRAVANDFDLGFIKGKKCLDAGCGSGRYSIALARNGAESVTAIDISKNGITEAQKRAVGIPQIQFQLASTLNLPFQESEFDFVLSAGVIHHTPDFDGALLELFRVLKPGGKLFLLVYGTGGLRWTAIKSLRPIVSQLGIEFLDNAITLAKLPSNNRKHFLDDLFVPIQILTGKNELIKKLNSIGITDINFWENETYDHESSPKDQINDLIKINKIMLSCKDVAESFTERYLSMLAIEVSTVFLNLALSAQNDEGLSSRELRNIMIGTGNLRVIATKNSDK
jgi:ubiquinone/menaquinone biosynthesis C-methylase UbiE